jgi:hypothetical protein
MAARLCSTGRRALERGAREWSRQRGCSYGERILTPAEANAEIARRLRGPAPVLVGRVGATEQAVIRRHAHTERWPEVVSPLRYGPGLRWDICNLSGFFPTDSRALCEFSELYRSCLGLVDVFATWRNRFEGEIVRRYLPRASVLVPLRALAPLSVPQPWTHALEGRHVLVVHPFAETIRDQLCRLDEIYPGGLWPDCRIDVMPAVQSLGGVPDGPYRSWFDALEEMSGGIERFTGDTVIIGAGAYGLPLGARAVQCGKSAIVVGGVLQIFFGIRGARWDARPEYARLPNDAWVRPRRSERPSTAQRVEHGCYW